jgi:hypothetical protein
VKYLQGRWLCRTGSPLRNVVSTLCHDLYWLGCITPGDVILLGVKLVTDTIRKNSNGRLDLVVRQLSVVPPHCLVVGIRRVTALKGSLPQSLAAEVSLRSVGKTILCAFAGLKGGITAQHVV